MTTESLLAKKVKVPVKVPGSDSSFQRKHEILIVFHVEATGEIRLNEELAEVRLIEVDKLRPWESGTGLAVADWLKARGIPVV